MNKLKECTFSKKLVSLVIPMALQQLIMNLVSASDALMLGAVSQNELSAVSLAGQIQFVLSLFLAAITIGTNIFVAQYWGKGDIDAVEKFFGIAISITIPVSAIFSFCTLVFPEHIMKIFTTEITLIESGSVYLRLAGPSYLFCGVSQVYLCIMKNTGQANKSTIILGACAVLDVIMNAVFIFGLLGFPEIRISGAAISTTVTMFLALCWCIIAFKRKNTLTLRIKYIIHQDKRLKKDFWKYTSPILANELIWGIGFTMYTVIMGHLGNDAVAANSIASIARNLVVCFCTGLANGGGILVGNELGAGNLLKAKQYGGKLTKLSVISGLATGGLLLCIVPFVTNFANLSETANSYLGGMLIASSIYMVGKSMNGMTIAGIFCAGGDSRFGLYCDAVVMWCITVPLGLLSAFVLKLPVLVVYCIVNADEFFKLPAVYRHYKKYLWVKDLTVKENGL